MTFPLGLQASELEAMEAQMRTSYRTRTLPSLLDFSHQPVADLRSSRIGGAIQVKADGDGVTRSATLDLFDPTDMLGLGDGSESRSPNRFLYVRKGIFVEALGRWIDIPVFMGPITKPSRTGDVLTIEAQDKAGLSLDPRPTFAVKAGTNIGSAIEIIMRECVGETRFRLATTTRRLVKEHTVSPDQPPWALVRKLAASLGWVVFYDGEGYLVARPPSTTPVTVFRGGPGGSLTTKASSGFWDGDLVNRVTVIGGTVGKTTIEATVTAEEADPLSPESLAFGDVPWVKTEVITDTEISSWAEARALAEETLRKRLVQQTTGTFEALPFWHLQEWDAYTFETGSGLVTAALTETTIPLDSSSMQSFGMLRRPSPSQRKVRVAPRSSRLAAAERKRKAGRK